MTSEQDIRERVAAAKAAYDRAKAERIEKSDASLEEWSAGLNYERLEAAAYIDTLLAETARLRTQLAAAEQARDAAVAALEPFADIWRRYDEYLDEEVTYFNGRDPYHVIDWIQSWWTGDHNGIFERAAEIATEQAARQPDDAAEGSGGG